MIFKQILRDIDNFLTGQNVVSPKKVPFFRGRNSAFLVAQGEIGVKEFKGDKHHKRILEYHSTVGDFSEDEVPWCSSFMNWCSIQAGKPHTNKANARSWLKIGKAVFTPKPGDIAVFRRGPVGGWQGHVGFYVDRIGDDIIVLGGNQNDSVCYRKYPYSKLIGYRRV